MSVRIHSYSQEIKDGTTSGKCRFYNLLNKFYSIPFPEVPQPKEGEPEKMNRGKLQNNSLLQAVFF
jgi:hypothetical protein